MAITQKFKDDLIKASQTFEKWKSQGNNYFNIFDALGVVHKENYHSAFIAYLLDKNSEHYQSKFAELFLEKLKDAIPNKVFGNLSVENLQNVETEAVTEKIAQNRRVDILLRFDNFVNIIIENKIYAKDQNSQIKDYVANFANSPNKTLVIYLHPNEIDPSEVSFGKTSGKWYLDKDGQYCAIRDNGGNIKAYYFQMSYKWIKCWIESCIKWFEKQTQSKIDNGLNKIIFGLNQYIEILEWYITGEWDGTNAVTKFIMKNHKNQQMALEIMHSKDKNLREYKEILDNLWNEICESVVENFYKKLLEKFGTRQVEINGEIWLCERLDENRVYYERFRFYPQKYEGYTNFPRLFLYYDGSNFKDIGLSLRLFCQVDIDAREHKKLEEIFQRNYEKNGIRKYKDSYISTKVFTDKPTDSPIENFAEWLIKQGEIDEQVKKFIQKIDGYITNNAIIKETLEKLDKLAK